MFCALVLASVFPSTPVPRRVYWLSCKVGRYSACQYRPVCFPRLPYRAAFIGFLVKSGDILPASTDQCVCFPRLPYRVPIYWFCVKLVDILPASTGQCVSLDFRTAPRLL